MTADKPPKICAINFWPDFRLETSFLGYLLNRAFSAFEVVPSQAAADLVATSVFVQTKAQFPAKTLALIWENLRPVHDVAQFSLSFDFDSYDGRNCRLPFWWSGLAWPGFELPATTPNDSNHGFEPLIAIDDLLRERSPGGGPRREKFCAFVAGNPEPHRMAAAGELSKIAPVDVFGNVARRPLRGSKLELFRGYRFALCFENSMFPGYYTEKPVHAWAGGAVPLYFADTLLQRDFNPKALVNRAEFASLTDFRRHVAILEASRDAQAEITSQPLLREAPDIEPVIAFLRETLAKARRASPAAPAGAATRAGPVVPKVGRNDPCPCGSGRKYKQCHGKIG